MFEIALAVGVSVGAGLALLWLTLDLQRSVEDRRIEQAVLAIAIAYGAREQDYAALTKQGLFAALTLQDAMTARGIGLHVGSDPSEWCADFVGTQRQPAVAVGRCEETSDSLLVWATPATNTVHPFDSLSRRSFTDLTTSNGSP